MKKNTKKTLCLLLASAMLTQGVSTYVDAKAKLAKTKLTITINKKETIKIKNKRKGAKYTFKLSKKKIASVSSKGVVKALKVGTVKITVKEIFKGKSKSIGKVTVVCKKKEATTPQTSQATPSASTNNTANSTATATATAITTEAATDTPTASPTPSPTPTPIGPAEYAVPYDYDKVLEGNVYSKKQPITYFSTTTNKDRKANVILPTNYSTDKKYPVLYMLHGIGGDENEWMSGKPQNIIANLVAKDLAKEMILVIPNCRARENDAASNEYSLDHYAAFDNFINDLRDNLMPYIKEHYSIAEGRENTGIVGFSMGGRESLNIGLHMPETFGYIAAFSPGYGVFAYEANGVSEPGLFTEETLTLPDEYKKNTVIMINHGTNESGDIAKTCDKALTAHGIPHDFYSTNGGHEMKVWKHGLYNFMKRIFK